MFKATKGLFQVSESLIIGASVGAAMIGMKPIPEIQFSDFITCAMDQVIQQAAKMRYRTGGNWTTPKPGLIVVAPSTPYDAKGLLKSAVRGEDVTIIAYGLMYHRLFMRRLRQEEFFMPSVEKIKESILKLAMY